MAQEMGESRDAWGMGVLKLVENFANNMKHEDKPYYIVYAAKQDRYDPQVFRQTIKAYYHKPAPLLGILVWYVDNAQGRLDFMPELSAPPDVPLDSRLLSLDSKDQFSSVMSQGKKLHAIVS